MQLEELQNLIALYTLDLLDESERRLVEEAIASSPALQTELIQLQATVAAIPYSATPVPIAADLKARLFDRIDSRDKEPNSLSIEALRKQAANASWQPFAPVPGVAVSKF